MEFKELEQKLIRSRAFEKYFFSAFAIGIICFSLYMMFFDQHPHEKDIIIISGCTIFITMGLYTLTVALKIDRFTVVENNFSEPENTTALRNTVLDFSNALMQNNYTTYIHRKKNLFRTPFEIYLYSGHNFIALNVMKNSGKGIVDFGNSARLKNKFIKIFKEHCASVNYNKA